MSDKLQYASIEAKLRFCDNAPSLAAHQNLEAGVHRIPRALAHTFVQKKKSGIRLSRFRQNFPWGASPEALLEVFSDENIGRTDKLSRSS